MVAAGSWALALRLVVFLPEAQALVAQTPLALAGLLVAVAAVLVQAQVALAALAASLSNGSPNKE